MNLTLNLGYLWVFEFKPELGGQMLPKLRDLRQRLLLEKGVTLPQIRIKDDPDLDPGGYTILLNDWEVGTYILPPDCSLILDPGYLEHTLSALNEDRYLREPISGRRVLGITPEAAARVAALGYSVVNPQDLLLEHLVAMVEKIDEIWR